MQSSAWILYSFVVIVLINTTECAISNWTNPLILTAEGSRALTKKINDGTSLGDTTDIMIAARSSTNGAIAYTLETQAPTSPVLAISNSTGDVTVTSGTVSYSSVASFTLIVSASDDGGSTSSTATVTLSVNAAPSFPSYSTNPCIEDGAAAGTELINLSANDPNSDTLLYAIDFRGNTYSHFLITTAGVVEVNIGPLDKANTSSYTLVITAADDSTPTPLTASATVTATVSSTCSGAAILSVSFMTILSALIHCLL